MRRVARVLVPAALLLAVACGGPEGGGLVVSPSTPEPLAELLVEMPAGDARSESELAAAIHAQGEPALGTLVEMIGSPAADDDAAARFAIETVTRWAGRPGRDDTRAGWAAMLVTELERDPGVERSRFLLAQLERVGGAAEVDPVAALLGDPELSGDAARTLAAIGGDRARAAVATGLVAAPTADLVAAAGRLGAVEAIPMITVALSGDDAPLRSVAASALADLATPEAGAALVGRLPVLEEPERGMLAGATLRFAVRTSDRDAALDAVRAVLTVADEANDGALLVAGMRTLAGLSSESARELLAELDPADARTARELARLGRTLDAAAAETERAMAEIDEGFVPLFNGEDFTGWVGATDGYFVEGGAIVCDPETGGNLYTEGEYADFVLRFEFRLTPGANNGLGIRAPLEGDAAYVGMELQVLDDGALGYADLRPYQYHGSIYGVAAVERGHQRPVGEWNEQEVLAHGRRVRVTLNGAVVLDVDLDEVSRPETADGRDHPGLARESGHIGFLGHGSRVEFRNIRIREIE